MDINRTILNAQAHLSEAKELIAQDDRSKAYLQLLMAEKLIKEAMQMVDQ